MPHTFGGKKVREPGAQRRKMIRIVAVAIVAIIAGAGLYIYISNTYISTQSSTSTTETTSCTTGTLVLGAPKGPYAKINTSLGCIEVQLYPSAAPKTVANFINLSQTGFFNNLVWHRIESDPSFSLIQTGDPNTRNGTGDRSTWGMGGSSKTVPLEINSTLHNYVGYLGMARTSDPNSGSSQFYINLSNNTSLDGQYTVFGKVISGIEIARAIDKVPVNTSHQPITPVFVTSITIQDTP